MLGLLAHGLHLLLVVLGSAGVGALLLPQLRAAHLARGATFRPPATAAEHDRRVAALRSAARAGQLTAPPPPGSSSTTGTEWPGETRSSARVRRDGSSWRAVAVSSSAAASVVHGAMLPHHLGEGLLIASFFAVSALWQASWAFRVAREATRRLLLVGIAGNLAIIGLWATTRTVGLPFGLTPGPEGVGGWDAACVVWEWAVVLACTAGLHTSQDQRRLVLGGLTRPAWLWVGLSAVTLVVLSLTVSHG